MPTKAMSPILRASEIPHSEVVEHLARTLNGNFPLYQGARVRCVAVRQEQEWSSALLSVRGVPNDDRRKSEGSRDYGHVRLLEEWVSERELLTLLDSLTKCAATIDSCSVHFAQPPELRQIEFLAANNDYATQQGYSYSSATLTRPPISQDPLLTYALPYYSDVFSAIKDWGEFRRFNNASDARVGSVLVFLPECRARLSTCAYDDEAISIEVERPGSVADLRLRGTCSLGGEIRDLRHDIRESVARIEVGEPPDHFEIVLLDSNDTLYDYHKETPFLLVGRHRIFGATGVEGDASDLVGRAIRKGEGESLEFKPYIRPRDRKQKELVETAIAFANTRGGSILIGVTDHCDVVGIERELVRDGKGSLEDGRKAYLGELRRLFSQEIVRDIEIELEVARYAGRSVVVVRVPEGRRKPYSNRATKEIHVRRGASNVRPDPYTELPELVRGASGSAEELIRLRTFL